jgi:DNA-binding MarR family transcriptional regulator
VSFGAIFRQPHTCRSRRAAIVGDNRFTKISGLFSTVRERVLGLLFGQPDRSFYTGELIHLVDAESGAVQREIARLEQSGLITMRHAPRGDPEALPSESRFSAFR